MKVCTRSNFWKQLLASIVRRKQKLCIVSGLHVLSCLWAANCFHKGLSWYGGGRVACQAYLCPSKFTHCLSKHLYIVHWKGVHRFSYHIGMKLFSGHEMSQMNQRRALLMKQMDTELQTLQTRGKLLLHFIDVNSTLAEVELVLTFFSPGSFFLNLFLLLDWDWIRIQNSAP
jgi:hypothetical protein